MKIPKLGIQQTIQFFPSHHGHFWVPTGGRWDGIALRSPRWWTGVYHQLFMSSCSGRNGILFPIHCRPTDIFTGVEKGGGTVSSVVWILMVKMECFFLIFIKMKAWEYMRGGSGKITKASVTFCENIDVVRTCTSMWCICFVVRKEILNAWFVY